MKIKQRKINNLGESRTEKLSSMNFYVKLLLIRLWAFCRNIWNLPFWYKCSEASGKDVLFFFFFLFFLF